MKKIILLCLVAIITATCVSNEEFDTYVMETEVLINNIQRDNDNQDAAIADLVNNLEITVAALKADISANAGNITANSERLVAEVESITLALDALVQADAEISEQLVIIQNSIVSLIENFDNEIKALESDISEGLYTLEYDLTKVIDGLREELVAADNLILSLSNAYADANDQVGITSVDGLQDQIDEIATDLVDVEDKVLEIQEIIDLYGNPSEMFGHKYVWYVGYKGADNIYLVYNPLFNARYQVYEGNEDSGGKYTSFDSFVEFINGFVDVYNPGEETSMNYNYDQTSKSNNPTWTFSYSIANPNPNLDVDLYIYEGAEGETWDDDDVFTTPPGTLVGIAHVSTGASQVNIPNLDEGDFVVVRISSPTGKSTAIYKASSRAGSSKSSGKIVLTF